MIVGWIDELEDEIDRDKLSWVCVCWNQVQFWVWFRISCRSRLVNIDWIGNKQWLDRKGFEIKCIWYRWYGFRKWEVMSIFNLVSSSKGSIGDDWDLDVDWLLRTTDESEIVKAWIDWSKKWVRKFDCWFMMYKAEERTGKMLQENYWIDERIGNELRSMVDD